MSIEIIPENAPFTDDQRAWLNGFFVGYIGLENADLNSTDDSTVEDDEDYPWHDDTMPLEERMELAKDRTFNLQLMAAMGQQDCGQCGYLCKTYAEAIVTGAESDLTLCSPGGRPTSKKLKSLMADAPAVELTEENNNQVNQSSSSTEFAYDRKHPFLAKVKSVSTLNADHSVKDTRHVEIDLSGSGITYQPGDALGIYPKNPPELADKIISFMQVDPNMLIVMDNYELTLQNVLSNYLDITKPSDESIEYLSQCASDETEKEALVKLSEEGIEEGCDLLELLEDFNSVEVDPIKLVNSLGKIQPRLYSISSTLSAHPDEVHATVGVVEYKRRDRSRVGVASTFLSQRLKVGDTIRVYIQPTHEFLLPENPDTPVIMVGPGTGIAPFRAFLHERSKREDTGKNWLFFGNPSEENDFLYKDELMRFLEIGCLTRLDTAFSRDQEHKIYVQDRMLECAKVIWSWISKGANFYVCGDAIKMAKDVDHALKKIVQQEGGMSETGAEDFVKTMTKNKRYLRDVY
ncbi:MAG: sulfite reductase subunit alpha [Pseudomonadota bacterium]